MKILVALFLLAGESQINSSKVDLLIDLFSTTPAVHKSKTGEVTAKNF